MDTGLSVRKDATISRRCNRARRRRIVGGIEKRMESDGLTKSVAPAFGLHKFQVFVKRADVFRGERMYVDGISSSA
jgi:hypothetical protein